jgi:hypothetical protein
MSPVAICNIKNIVRKLDSPHIFLKSKQSLFNKAFREAIKHLNGQGSYEIIDKVDRDLIRDIARNYAARLSIPLLMTGFSKEHVEKIFNLHHYESATEEERKKRLESGILKLMDIFTSEQLANWWDPGRYPDDQIPRSLFPFYAWNFPEQEVIQNVAKAGLILRSSCNPLVTNSKLVPVMGVLDVRNIGYSSFEPEVAKTIREGRADRDFWLNVYQMLEYSGKTGWLLEKEVKQTLKELGIQPGEVGL